MKISQEQYKRIEKYFPVQRGNVKINNYDFIYRRKWVQMEGVTKRVRQLEQHIQAF